MVSVAVHLTAGFFVLLAIHLLSRRDADGSDDREASREEAQTEFEIELPERESPRPNVPLKTSLTADPQAVFEGGTTVARVDQKRRGRGGDGMEESAINHAEQDDRLSRDPHTMSHLTASQHQRIRSGRERRSWEDLRASREPLELTFVAMGDSGSLERRGPEAAMDPATGTLTSLPRANEGAMLGSVVTSGGPDMTRSTGAAVLGSERASPGLGLPGRARRGPSQTAFDNARARPLVAKNDPSVTATAEGKPSDTVDTDQADAARLASIIHASTAGGDKGKGRGGEKGPGAVGAQGTPSSAGQTAAAMGQGGSGEGDLVTMGYVRAVQSKVHPFWEHAFPRWAILEGKSGFAIVSVTLDAEGRVVSTSIARASSVPEFDENVQKAIRDAAPFGPLPSALKPRFTLQLTFSAVNPAVRPKHAQNGPN